MDTLVVLLMTWGLSVAHICDPVCAECKGCKSSWSEICFISSVSLSFSVYAKEWMVTLFASRNCMPIVIRFISKLFVINSRLVAGWSLCPCWTEPDLELYPCRLRQWEFFWSFLHLGTSHGPFRVPAGNLRRHPTAGPASQRDIGGSCCLLLARKWHSDRQQERYSWM